MAFRVDLTERAERDLERLYQTINAEESRQARAWFNGLETLILSLDEHPARGAVTPDDNSLRQLLYGRNRNVYRIIYAVDEGASTVTVLHIRHSARDAMPSADDDA